MFVVEETLSGLKQGNKIDRFVFNLFYSSEYFESLTSWVSTQTFCSQWREAWKSRSTFSKDREINLFYPDSFLMWKPCLKNFQWSHCWLLVIHCSLDMVWYLIWHGLKLLMLVIRNIEELKRLQLVSTIRKKPIVHSTCRLNFHVFIIHHYFIIAIIRCEVMKWNMYTADDDDSSYKVEYQ